jgi:hypothetical protein
MSVRMASFCYSIKIQGHRLQALPQLQLRDLKCHCHESMDSMHWQSCGIEALSSIGSTTNQIGIADSDSISCTVASFHGAGKQKACSKGSLASKVCTCQVRNDGEQWFAPKGREVGWHYLTRNRIWTGMTTLTRLMRGRTERAC